VGLGYQQPFPLLPGVTLTLYDAGHMLGSALVALDFQDGGEKPRRLVFSGDLGRTQVPILRDPTLLEAADLLLLEGTYGNRTHPPIEESAAVLAEVIRETSRRGGKVIIPAFAVERTQLLVYLLNRLYHQGELPEIPIFVDSPLAVDVTSVFRHHPECFDEDTLKFLRQDPDQDVFGFRRLRYIRETQKSKELNSLNGPAVIISASGMAEAGRIQHHLKNNLEDPRNTVLIVGWQAPNTLGRRLVEKQPVVRIFGEEYTLRARVVALNGFSGHADRPGLLAWVKALKRRPAHIFLVHGEPEGLASLAAALQNDLGCPQVTIPEPHQTVAC
jgi:metallo-beta-lactamase family protein